MSNFRPSDSSFSKASLFSALSVAGVAAIVYALTLANYVFPGDSARLLVQWSGIDTLTFPVGVRSVVWTADKGMYLNGKPYPIKGICCHQDHAAFSRL